MVILLNSFSHEYFVNKDQRAGAIYQWFTIRDSDDISYSDYKSDIDHSDIIEYSQAKILHNEKKLTTENMRKHM